MKRQASVILLEFNELTPSLMTRFVEAGKLPNFARLFEESRVFTTDAGESGTDLNPWIQWVTVHTGLTAAEHGVRELGEAQRLDRPGLTELLSEAGRRVWICGSMNVRYGERLNGCVLPDPWTTVVKPYPDELLPYYRFIQKNVHDHAGGGAELGRSDYLSFARFMATHGLSASTSVAIVRQLLSERGDSYRWKRVTVMDRLQWDVFRWYHRRVRPHFSTFFLNSTAHLQHKYWRNLEPERFKIKPQADEQAELSEAILCGYRHMDELVGRFLKLASDGATLMFCTALSQQPCLRYEDSGGKGFYKARDIEELLSFAGLAMRYRYSPVMSEQFHLTFDDERQASEAARRLTSLRVMGDPALFLRREGAQLFGGCSIFRQLPPDSLLECEASGAAIPFFDVFYQAKGLKSGMHHPDGMLWIRLPDRSHGVATEKVSLLSIAPTVLRLLSVTPPAWMQGRPLIGLPRDRVASRVLEAG